MTPTKFFLATKALIVHDGKILVVRESRKYKEGTQQGKYDVIGGRIEVGEHFKESLLREIREEVGLAVEIEEPFFVNEVRPNVHGEEWQIVRIFFRAKATEGTVTLSEDHDHHKWIDPRKCREENVIENLNEVFDEYKKRF